MTDLYGKESRYKFDRELDREDSPKLVSELAVRCTLGKKIMNQYKTAGTVMAILGLGGTPWVYQMWEAKQAGAGVPFAMMAGLVGIVGLCIAYDSKKSVQELQRREELALEKASELEQIR